MDIEILMSTMNKKNINELNLKNKNIGNNILIINQTNNDNKYEYKDKNIRMYNYNEVGLSKSRNRALENAQGDICVIADDDIRYKRNGLEIIKNSFENNPEADIITFQIETPNGNLFKKYSSKEYFHSKRTILKVSSIEIAIRRDKILDSGICFDENFGLGAKYDSGEENIFLMDCLKNGLKIKYIPIPIIVHPLESSGDLNNKTIFFSKGALFARLFGIKCIFANLLFAFKKNSEYNNHINFLEAIISLYQGSIDFLKNNKI